MSENVLIQEVDVLYTKRGRRRLLALPTLTHSQCVYWAEEEAFQSKLLSKKFAEKKNLFRQFRELKKDGSLDIVVVRMRERGEKIQQTSF